MNTLALSMPGGTEMIILLALGLLLFGRRLPEVGRSLGRSIVEFKKGIKGIEDEIDTEVNASTSPREISQPQKSQQLPAESAPRTADERTVSREPRVEPQEG